VMSRFTRNEGGFFSDYYLAELLQRRHKGKLGENTRRLAWRRLSRRWDRVTRSLGRSSTGAKTRRLWLMPLFAELRYELVSGPTLFEERQRETKISCSHVFQPDSSKAPLVYVDLHPWGQDLESPLPGERRRNTPRRKMERILDMGNARWGIVTNGKVIRLLRREQVGAGRRYFEVDLENVFEEEDESSFAVFWALFRAEVFVPDESGQCLIDRISEGCQHYAVRVSDELRESVRKALEDFVRGVMDEPANRENLREVDAKELFGQGLIFLYRLLFVLYAESRDLLPIGNPIYRENYSLEALRDLVEDPNERFSSGEYWIQKSLQALFKMIKEGVTAGDLMVPAYDGGLFQPDATPLLESCRVPDSCLSRVIETLSVTVPQRRVGRERIAYRELGIEELGAIYEGLLQYEPKIAGEEVAVVRTRGSEEIILPLRSVERETVVERIPAGTFYLATWGGSRKQSGTYNTPLKITEWLVRQALQPLVEGKSSEEILELNVLDPAMGSGAFLVSACHFLADVYAAALVAEGKEIREHIDEEARAEYRRLVAERCLYGVDLNPLAVELAKVSLWLTTIAKGKPLTFLDQNLRCGNSLIGARIDDLVSYPWKAVGKREPRKRKALLGGQLTLDDVGILDSSFSSLAKSFDSLERMGDETLEVIQRKAYLFGQDRKKGSFYSKCKMIADLWCSLWFWPKGEEAPDERVYTELVKKVFTGSCKLSEDEHEAYFKQVEKNAEENHFFHWELQFPGMFFDENGRKKSPGFDCVIGNPPWEKIKVLDREFFAAYYPNIANAATADIREELIGKLEKTNPKMSIAYKKKRTFAGNFGHYLRLCGRFPFGSVGDINLYPIFLELSRTLVNEKGRCGIIVKSGIFSGFTYRKFLSELVNTSSLVICHDFINKQGIFPGVIGNVRFTLSILRSPQKNGEASFIFSVLNESLEDLGSKDRCYSLTAKDLRLFNPNTFTLPLFYSRRDFEICRRIYQRTPVLIGESKNPVSNPWDIEYWRMYDMTNDSKLFAQKEELLEKGFKKKSSLFIKGDNTFVPLLEGKMIYRFDHRFGSFEGIPRESRFGTKAEPNHPSDLEKSKPGYETEPRYWVPKKDVISRCAEKRVQREPQFAFRGICNAFTDSRTTIGTIIPFCATSNGVPILIFQDQDAYARSLKKVLFACLFSSFTFDYLARQKINVSNLNKFMLIQIAAPTPDQFKTTKLRYNNVEMPAEEWILQKSALLFGVAESILPVLSPFGIENVSKWDSDMRSDASCFVDAVIAHVYGLSRNEYEYIMTQFPIFQSQEEAIYSKYISFDRCLAYFDALEKVESAYNVTS